jgi:hypothetical protein
MPRQSKGKLVTDAFKQVSIEPLYRNRWITAYDWVRIINHAHGFSPDRPGRLDTATLVKSLARDPGCRGADDPPGMNGLFRNHYSPMFLPDGSRNVSTSRVYCYYITDNDKSPPTPKSLSPNHWYDCIIRDLDLQGVTWSIAKEQKSELAAALGHITPRTAITEDYIPPGTALKSAPTATQTSPLETTKLVPSEDSASKTDSPAPGTALKPAPTVPQISPVETAKSTPSSAGAKRPAEIPWNTPAWKRTVKGKPTEMVSPVSAALSILHPQKSKAVLKSRSDKSAVVWVDSKGPPNIRAVNRNVKELEPFLASMRETGVEGFVSR